MEQLYEHDSKLGERLSCGVYKNKKKQVLNLKKNWSSTWPSGIQQIQNITRVGMNEKEKEMCGNKLCFCLL